MKIPGIHATVFNFKKKMRARKSRRPHQAERARSLPLPFYFNREPSAVSIVLESRKDTENEPLGLKKK